MPFDNQRATIKQPDLNSMKSPNVDALGGGQAPGAVDAKQEIEQFLEQIAQYNQIGKILKRESLKEAGEKLAKIADIAEVAVTTEAADWFDAHTLKRNMKEVKSYAGDFLKLASEADTINQRMSALYDDMGRILERYFEIPDDLEHADPIDHSDPSEIPTDEPVALKETGPGARDPKVYSATPLPPVTPDPKEIDKLTLRAIQSVHTRLKAKNPAVASKFAAMDPKKMKEVVWVLAQRM